MNDLTPFGKARLQRFAELNLLGRVSWTEFQRMSDDVAAYVLAALKTAKAELEGGCK